jgi:hypothetical protein
MTPVSSGFTKSAERAGPIAAALAIASLMLCSDSILLVSSWCKSLLAFAAFAALIAFRAPAVRRRKDGTGTIRLTLALAGMYALLRLDTPVGRLIAVSWLLLCLGASRFLLIHWAGLLYAVFLAIYRRSDAAWFGLKYLAERLPGDTTVGFWASGLQVYMLGIGASLIGLCAARRRGNFLKNMLPALVVSGVGFISGRAILVRAAPTGHLDVSLVHGAAVLITALAVSKIRPARPGWAGILLVSSLITLAALSPNAPVAPSAESGNPSGIGPPSACDLGPGRGVGLYSRGLLDWQVPDMERSGLASSGMFGLFREDLSSWSRLNGGEVTVLDSISRDGLSRIGLLIMINPAPGISSEETRRIEEFVREGNGLLVLGDHTDIGGSRGSLNSILGFTGIRFNYDSAIPLRPGWHGCLEIRQHQLTAGIGGGRGRGGDLCDQIMLQIGIGASLDVEAPASPLIVARYGFSDSGDPANAGHGGQMGNVAHEPGEAAGDLVLAACQSPGRGRVVVFGDTSPFQNAALFLSRGLVRNCFDWLRGNEIGDGGPNYRDLVAGRPGAIVDFSCQPDASLAPFSERSLGGLANCLARAGVTAVPALRRDDWEQRASFLFLINPTKPMSIQTSEWLIRYMTSGGHLILAKGHTEPEPVEALISRYHLSIGPVPLGGGDASSALDHKDAWAIESGPVSPAGPPSSRVLSSAFGHPTAITRTVGRGSLTLIADSGLLLDGALESEWAGNPTNIAFVTGLVDSLIGDTCYAEAR